RRGWDVDREGRALAGTGFHAQRAFGFLDESLDDVQSEAGALTRGFGGEIRLKNLGQNFRRNARAVVSHGNLHDGRRVFEILHVQAASFRAVLERRQIQRLGQHAALNFHRVVLRRALEAVHGQVQENLNQVGAVDAHADVFGERMDHQLIISEARMHVDELVQVVQELVHRHARRLIRLLAQKAEVTARNLNAIRDLPRDDFQPVLDEFQVFDANAISVGEALVHQLHEAGNDRERAVNIVDNARVDFAAGGGDLLVDFLVLQFGQHTLKLLGVVVNFTFERAALHRVRDGGAHCGNIKRLVDVITRA